MWEIPVVQHDHHPTATRGGAILWFVCLSILASAAVWLATTLDSRGTHPPAAPTPMLKAPVKN